MTEYVATLTDDEIGLILHPKTGVVVRCEFLPKIADLAKIVDEPRLKAEANEATLAQFRGHPNSGYRRFGAEQEEAIEVPPLDRRKQVVAEVLGYDPQRKGIKPPRGPLVPPTAADLEEVRAKSKIPDAPLSEPFKAWLRESGYAATLAAQGKPVPVWMQEDQ
jgi:hypothetical protein